QVLFDTSDGQSSLFQLRLELRHFHVCNIHVAGNCCSRRPYSTVQPSSISAQRSLNDRDERCVYVLKRAFWDPIRWCCVLGPFFLFCKMMSLVESRDSIPVRLTKFPNANELRLMHA